jgi:hypothetical protein
MAADELLKRPKSATQIVWLLKASPYYGVLETGAACSIIRPCCE